MSLAEMEEKGERLRLSVCLPLIEEGRRTTTGCSKIPK